MRDNLCAIIIYPDAYGVEDTAIQRVVSEILMRKLGPGVHKFVGPGGNDGNQLVIPIRTPWATEGIPDDVDAPVFKGTYAVKKPRGVDDDNEAMAIAEEAIDSDNLKHPLYGEIVLWGLETISPTFFLRQDLQDMGVRTAEITYLSKVDVFVLLAFIHVLIRNKTDAKQQPDVVVGAQEDLQLYQELERPEGPTSPWIFQNSRILRR